jgi:hypothetical protein
LALLTGIGRARGATTAPAPEVLALPAEAAITWPGSPLVGIG